jgi:DNA-binding response OmpR family regulator
MDQQRILVVEGDAIIKHMMEVQLVTAGYAVIGAEGLVDALAHLAHERFDLLIVDLCLNVADAIKVIATARNIDPDIVVIALSCKVITISAIADVSHYVHRCLIKPVRSDDLVRSAVDALALRRRVAECQSVYQGVGGERAEPHIIHVGPLRIDPYRHRVTHSGQPLSLTSCEFSLLIYLTRRRGVVVTPLEIVRDVLHYPCSLLEARDLSKSHIHRLRRKIEPTPKSPRLIHSVRGAGYRLADEDELESSLRSAIS